MQLWILAAISLASAAPAAYGQDAPLRPAPAGSADAPKLVIEADAATEPSREPLPGELRAAERQLFDWLTATSTVQADTRPSSNSFGPVWRLKSGIRFDGPRGVQLSAGVTARRGYSQPITTARPLGSDNTVAEGRNSSAEFGWAPMQVDTEVRVRVPLKTSGRVTVTVIAEGLNLLKLNPRDASTPRSPLVTSPAVRGGLELGF